MLTTRRPGPRSASRAIALGAVMATAACNTLFGVDDEIKLERQLGVLSYYDALAYIELPGSVRRGVPFDVMVRTYGGGCVAQGDTEVNVSGMVATIAPFDSFIVKLPSRRECTADLRYYQHRARMSFATTGQATVIIRGRREPGYQAVSIELPIVVGE